MPFGSQPRVKSAVHTGPLPWEFTVGPTSPGYSQSLFLGTQSRFSGFVGPVGSGKTVALCQNAVVCALSNPGCTGVLGAPTYPMAAKVTFPTFFKTLQASGVPYESWGGNNPRVVVHFSSRLGRRLSSEIFLVTASDPDSLRGPNLAWYGLDELTYCPWESWVQLQERLRDKNARMLKGFGVFTPNGFDAVWDYFVGDSYRTSPPGMRELIHAIPYENATNLQPGFYEELRRSMDIERFRQEVMGEFRNVFAKQVYWAFNRNPFPGHGNVGLVELDPLLPLCWVLDFNVDPMSSLIIQVQPEIVPRHMNDKRIPAQIRVIDEITLRSSSIQHAVEEFVSRYGPWMKAAGKGTQSPERYVPQDVLNVYQGNSNQWNNTASPQQPVTAGFKLYGDASNPRSHQTAEGDWQWLKQSLARQNLYPEMNVPDANPSVRDRVQSVNAMLCNAAGERSVVINPRCRELIMDMERVSWKAGSAGNVIDEADRKRTHTSSCLGYLIYREFPMLAASGYTNEGRIV